MKDSTFLVREANSVIPEVAKRLSGIQKKGRSWIPDLDFVLSGMMLGAVSRLFQQAEGSKQ